MKNDYTFFKTLGLGAIGGAVLGFLFVFIPNLFGRYNPADFDPTNSLDGCLYGIPIGLIVTPIFYFSYLKKYRISFRMILTVFVCVFLGGIVGFLIFPLFGIVTACIGFRWGCDVFKDAVIRKES